MSYNKDKQFNNGETLNAEDLNQLIEGINGSVTKIELGADNVTLTITKNDGTKITVTLPNGGSSDLTNYVTFDDYASQSTAGIVKISSNYGMQLIAKTIAPLIWDTYITKRSNAFMSYANLDKVVKEGLAKSQIDWTPTEKSDARTLLGAAKASDVVRDIDSTSIELTNVANHEYYYGVLANLDLKSLENGTNLGDMFYITFTSGEPATTLTVDRANAVFKEFKPEANSVVEICGKWNGSKWVVLFIQTAVA